MLDYNIFLYVQDINYGGKKPNLIAEMRKTKIEEMKYTLIKP